MQDRQLIASLFRRHYERMLLTARTLLRDPEAARDVVDDVFVELMESSRTLDSRIECTAEPTLLCTQPTNKEGGTSATADGSALLIPEQARLPVAFHQTLEDYRGYGDSH